MKRKKIIGFLDEEILQLLSRERPDVVERIKNNEITMWDDRIEHIKKHRFNFNDIYNFDIYVNAIPEIISKPDYIGYKEKDDSLQFIKEYNDNLLIAVRINNKGELTFRTMYPITDGQIKDYIKKNTLWKFSKTS